MYEEYRFSEEEARIIAQIVSMKIDKQCEQSRLTCNSREEKIWNVARCINEAYWFLFSCEGSDKERGVQIDLMFEVVKQLRKTNYEVDKLFKLRTYWDEMREKKEGAENETDNQNADETSIAVESVGESDLAENQPG